MAAVGVVGVGVGVVSVAGYRELCWVLLILPRVNMKGIGSQFISSEEEGPSSTGGVKLGKEAECTQWCAGAGSEGAVLDKAVDNEDMLGAVEGACNGAQEKGREFGHGAKMLADDR
jgi:hypothetical protein